MTAPAAVNQLKASFTTLLLGGCALVSNTAFAEENPQESGASPDTIPPLTGGYDDTSPYNNILRDHRSPTHNMEDNVNDFFQRKPKVRVTRESLFIGPATRYDIPLLPVDAGFMTVTRQYIELKPLRKEWYGHVSGIEYGFRADLGQGSYSLGGADWNFSTGATLGYYDSLRHDYHDEEDYDAQKYTRDKNQGNNRAYVFVEGQSDLYIGNLAANVIIGTSFNRVSGPDIGHANDARIYTRLEFPSLFGGENQGHSGLPGKFSGMISAYGGTESYGARLGIYFNDLKNEGKGINYSFGPEVRYDNENGASVRLRVRIAPKFW